MSYFKIIRKTIFNIWLIGILSFAIAYAGITLMMPLLFLGNIFLFMVDYGILFLATMIFLWKLSEKEGYTLGLAKQFDKKKYFKGVILGVAINFIFCALLMFLPMVNFIPLMLNYYVVFPMEILTDKFNIPEIPAVYISLIVDTPIILAVTFFGGCSGDKYATFIRESTKIETDSSELLTEERTSTPRKPGNSWRDSVKNKE